MHWIFSFLRVLFGHSLPFRHEQVFGRYYDVLSMRCGIGMAIFIFLHFVDLLHQHLHPGRYLLHHAFDTTIQ